MGSDDAFTAPLYSCIAGLASGLLLRAVRDGIAIKVAAMDYNNNNNNNKAFIYKGG